MFTFSPLPTWSDLFHGLLRANFNRSPAPIHPWAQNTKHAKWFSSGSNILGHIAKHWTKIHEGQKPVVWLPDYFCNSAIPLMRADSRCVVFYPINTNLNPDWPACELMLNTRPAPDIFILVHYFGHSADVLRASQFCNQTKSLLLEDGAHVLLIHDHIGKHSDASFYCPHKVLAAPDGALLTGKFTNSNESFYRNAFVFTWGIKRAIQKLLPRVILKRRIQSLPNFLNDLSEDKTLRTSASTLGQAMIRLYAERLEEIANTRKIRAQVWRNAFLPYNAICSPFLSIPDEGPAPYRFVLECKDQDIACRIFRAFRQSGIPVESWPDLAPEVRGDPAKHSVACQLRNTLLFFPVFNTLHLNLANLVAACMENANEYA